MDERLAEYRAVFSLFDLNGDGTVSRDELSVLLRSLGFSPSDEDLAGILASLHADDITFPAFVELMERQQAQASPAGALAKELEEAFLLFDRSGTGLITAHDLQFAFNLLGAPATPTEIANVVSQLSNNNLGLVSEADFRRLMFD